MALKNSLRLAGKISVIAAFAAGAAAFALQPLNTQLPTTVNDWAMPGTQELTLNVNLATADVCANCHGYYDDCIEPYSNWAATMMGQASRDPIWYAAMAVANQDAAFVGDFCIRCHAPSGWLHGKSLPPDGSALDVSNGDMDGVGCHFCHRLVDPITDPANPSDDLAILAGLTTQIPVDPHSGQYVVDPEDRRRGPFNLSPGFGYHEWRQSPFHQESSLCGTCHDVSNPAYSRQPDGSYALNAVDAEHPTHVKEDYFPVERTYSEWLYSQFAAEEIEMGGLFGGNKTAVSSCQDCHMPDGSGRAAAPQWGAQFRDDLPLHYFNGGNTWVLRAVLALYPAFETGLTAPQVDASINRATQMLQNASELEAYLLGNSLVVRVRNNTGHKLPTGYPEGRRMWINVKYFDTNQTLLLERGAYNPVTADLQTANTTVFEAELGVDAATSAASGVAQGVGFHFALNNVVYKDNRIPPRGFTNASYNAAGAWVVAEDYLDEQFWHDSEFPVPSGTTDIEVRLYYQTTSREYIEFLRSENTTDNSGNVAYDAWSQYGKSAPVEMESISISLAAAPCPTPIAYGLVTPNSTGSKMELSFSGSPSAAAGNFQLEVNNGKPNAMMAIFVGTESRHLQLPAGLFLLGGQSSRMTPVQLDGTGHTSIAIPISSIMVGTERYFQALCRDPGTAGDLALSNGLHVDFCD